MVRSVELLRIAACVAVVAFHLYLPGRALTLGGLHAFVVLTLAFSARSARRQSLRTFARGRALALGVPWLFWCALYALDGLRSHAQPLPAAFPWVLLTGTRVHLWFLPFALLSALLVAPLARRFSFRSEMFLLTSMLVAAAASDAEIEQPFAQWLSVLPSAALGLAISDVGFGDRGRVASLGALWCVSCGVAVALGFQSTFLPPLVGGALAIAAWALPEKATPRTVYWSRLSLGVYLSHPLFASATYGLVRVSAWSHFAATLALSLACTIFMKRTRVLSSFV